MSEVFEWRNAPSAQFAVIGDPVDHSRSPAMHNAAFKFLNLKFRYVAIRVPPRQVGLALDQLRAKGYRGVNVTVPHKLEVTEWCSNIDPFVSRVGAANTVDLRDKSCINTDAPGFLATLPSMPKQALVLGAGGSARSICAALENAGWKLQIYNRTRARAEEMVQSLSLNAQIVDQASVKGKHLIVNTTSASLTKDALSVDWTGASPDALAYDLVYGNTPFLAEAAQRGLRTLDGLALLVEQGALSLEWWLGVQAPRNVMMKAAHADP